MGRWVPVKEAALILGVSDDTLKRRLKLGQIEGQKEPTPKGFRWLVEVEGETGESPPEAAKQESEQREEPEFVLLRQMNDDLRAERERLWVEVESRRREVAELHVLLQQLQRSLPPPQERHDATAPAAVATVEAAVEPPRRQKWWKVWARG